MGLVIATRTKDAPKNIQLLAKQVAAIPFDNGVVDELP